MDWAIVSAFLVVCNVFVTVWVGARLGVILEAALEDLDAAIASAIRSVLENAGTDFEAPNPVQSAIAQFITTRLSQAPPETLEVIRDQGGKFA